VNLFAILLAALATTVHTHGLTAQLPPGWQAAPHSLTPQLLDPKERLSVGTYPLRYRQFRCSHMPSSALHDLGPSDAFVTLQERAHGSRAGFPRRPEHFGPHPHDARSDASECVPRKKGFVDHWFTFRDHGRHFYVLVAFGPRTSAKTRRQAWGILDGLRVERR
jgi:hypothetical protein